jgi:AcrR family transcriptional regulator
MGVMPARRYEQRLRAASAEATRRRILDAMYAHLPEIASVDAVARAAGVARSTVYLAFGSRAQLYDALAQDVLDRGGFEELTRAVGHPDPLEHLRGAMLASARMCAAQRDALRALRSTASSLDGAVARLDRNRLGGVEHLAARLNDHGLLRVPVPVAVDLLWLLTGFEAFDTLYTGRDLSADEVAARLTAAAESALLRRDPPDRATRPDPGPSLSDNR